MSVLTVGVGQTYATLAAAVAASGSFDTINVLAGTYTDDFTTISHPLTISGIGGLANFVAVSSPPNGKAIMTVDADLSINSLAFSGAAVGDGNGAGIRYESGSLTISNSWFHDNQDGILATPFVANTGTISIDHSEFDHNGIGDGFTHNLYVGDVAQLSVTNSYFHDVDAGHEIKSRAHSTVITNNVIADGPTASGSYLIDLPNGGLGTITGNVLEKGPNAQNIIFVSIGEETPVYPGTNVTISDNSLINDMVGSVPYSLRNPSDGIVTLTGNSLHGFPDGANAIGAAPGGNNALLPLPGPAYSTAHPFNLPPNVAVPEPMSITILLPMLAVVVAMRQRHRRGLAAARAGRRATQPIARCIC